MLFVPLFLAAAAALPAPAPPASAGMSASRLAKLDAAIAESIGKKECPGAVVLVGRHGKVVFRKAYGNRAVVPAPEPMTADTVFDMASLTKVVATATSVMTLVEDGKVRLQDRVTKFIPEFAAGGGARDQVTVEELLTHRAGLAADDPMALYVGTPQEIFERKYRQPLVDGPRRSIPVFGRRLRSAGRARAPRVFSSTRRIRASARLPAPRNEGNRLHPPLSFSFLPLFTFKEVFSFSFFSSLPHRPDREDQRRDPPRRRPRPARVRARRRRGARGAVLDGRRPRALLRRDAEGRRRRAVAGGRRLHAATPLLRRRSAARTRLGRRELLLLEPRRPLPARLGRTHGLDGHLDVARSRDGHVRDPPDEPQPPRRVGQRRRAAREGRDDRRERHHGQKIRKSLDEASEAIAFLAAIGAATGTFEEH